SIGCGDGTNDVPIINALVRRYSKIVYDLVEPADGYLDDFKALIDLNSKEWKGVTFIPHCQTMEEFIADREREKADQCIKYDVIYALHSLYYFKDPGAIIRTLCDWMQKDGLILLRFGEGAWTKCFLKYCEVCTIDRDDYVWAHAEEIVLSALEEIPDIQVERKPARKAQVKITECFQEDSEEGNKILDIIFKKDDFRKNVSQENVNLLLEYMMECCTREGDDMFFRSDDCDFIITTL
ncbi:histamine N-methyltransferase-like, partial [Glandiceps talaboti]